MFGFLKDKLNNFSSKLKETIAGKEKQETTTSKEEIKKEEKIETKTTKKETEQKKETKQEKKVTEIKTKKEEQQKNTQEKEKISQKQEIKQKEKKEQLEEPKKVEKNQKQEEQEKPKTEKKGFLSKILNFGKKETTQPQKLDEEESEKNKEKIEEEKLHDVEKKLIQEIEEEVKKEDLKEAKKVEKKEEKLLEKKGIIKQESIEIQEQAILEEEENEDEAKDISHEKEEVKAYEEKIIEQEKRIEEKRKELEKIQIKSAEEDKRELKANIGVGGKVATFLFGGVEIKEKEIEELLWELELSLIESDVEADAAHELCEQIKKRLVGQKVSAKNIDEYLNEQIKEILKEMMKTEKINLIEEIKNKKEKPYTILLLGPNGAGKTTSIGKLTHLLEKNKMSTIWAAGDTFRAAAIDQLEEHAKRLGVRTIKHQYGADPAAVAFDAIKAAQAGNIDVVLIDSAGRQETNKNLMEELRKIQRVAQPDLKLYVGEAYAGQGLLEQAKEFDEIIGIDGFILTKIDTDAKGGTTISLLYKIKKPILFIGTGQEYKDFEEFSEEFIINRII